MLRAFAPVYGLICYLAFFLVFLYAVAFVGDFWVPLTIDRGRNGGSLATTVLVDLALLGLFAVQHSGMARPAFKAWLTRALPRPLERSTYVLLTSLVLALVFWQWRPIPGVVWETRVAWSVYLLTALSALGWLLVLTATFAINHFDLFGLRQVWLAARNRPYTHLNFVEGFYYRMVRHPLMLGFIIAFWATPRMTWGHLVFSVATTGYILVAVKFMEERDLVRFHGDRYREYQHRVPMICPWPRPRRGKDPAGTVSS